MKNNKVYTVTEGDFELISSEMTKDRLLLDFSTLSLSKRVQRLILKTKHPILIASQEMSMLSKDNKLNAVDRGQLALFILGCGIGRDAHNYLIEQRKKLSMSDEKQLVEKLLSLIKRKPKREPRLRVPRNKKDYFAPQKSR